MDAATAQVREFNKALDQYQLDVQLQQQLGGAPSVIGNLADSMHFSANFTGDGFRVGFNTGLQLPPNALDLNGDGVKINPLASSNTFFDMEGDGYQHHTAWAAAGDAVLAYDANNDGVINQKNEIVFTEWDPTAQSDMQALRDVFDSNHDGKLDASDAKFARSRAIAMSEVRGKRGFSRDRCDNSMRQLAA